MELRLNFPLPVNNDICIGKKDFMYNFWGQRKPFVGEWNSYHRQAQETWKTYLKYDDNVMVFVSIPNKL